MTKLDAELMGLTSTELRGLIKRRKISPVELVEASLERAARLAPVLRAFTTLAPEYAMKRAQEAEKEVLAGRYRGPLHFGPG